LTFQSTPKQYFWYWTILTLSVDINSPEAFSWKITLLLWFVGPGLCVHD